MQRKIIRWFLWFFIGLIGISILVALVSFTYIYFNKERIIKEITSAIGSEINGEVVSEDFSINIFKYFPATSVNLKQFSARDSMYSHHRMELLHSENVFIKINFKDLFSSKIDIENITLENGSIYVFTDSSGYSNKYLLEIKTLAGSNTVTTRFKELKFINFKILYRDQPNNKFFNVFFDQLKCEFKIKDDLNYANIDAGGKIKFLGFNMEKGFYASNSTFHTRLKLSYLRNEKTILLPTSTLYLNNNPYEIAANFNFSDSSNFILDIFSERAIFSDLLKLTTQRVSQRLEAYDFKSPVKIEVHVSGILGVRKNPLVSIKLTTQQNILLYKDNEFRSCALAANFTNQIDTAFLPSDENTLIAIHNFTGTWEGIPLRSDSVIIHNLKKPHVTTVVYSSFSLKDIGKFSGIELFNFSNGTGDLNIDISAFPDKVNLNASFKGSLTIKNGKAFYGPRDMPFDNINGTVFINNSDVSIDNLSCNTGSSNLSLKGTAPGLIDFLFKDKQDAKLSWSIRSTYINLNDFMPFLSQRKGRKEVIKKQESVFFNELSKLDLFLKESMLDMKIYVNKIVFQNFEATNLSGEVNLIKNEWRLNKIHFNHAGGVVDLNGLLMETSPDLFSVHVDAEMEKLNINKVFESFDNFGQTTITNQNIEGILKAKAKINFNMNNHAFIQQSTLSGAVNLSVTDGQLKGFQPMGKLVKFVFPKRDFNDIQFSEIANSFAIKGNEIYFDRMKVNTSVMEMYLEGSYFLDGKTDMDIQIPLSNLKKREWEELSDEVGDKGDKGMNVFIKATTDEQKVLKFKYDPLRKIKSRNSDGIRKLFDRLKK